MLDLTKKRLPDSVMVEGRDYKIKTDFRNWILFGRMARERPLLSDFDIFYGEEGGMEPEVPRDRQKGFEALARFYNPKSPLPRSSGGTEAVVDFDMDADLVFSAFWHYYGIRLTGRDLHWHEFLALFRGLKETKLNDVMSWRSFTPDNSKGMERYNQQMNELKNAWALNLVSKEDQEALDKFNARFS